MLRTMTSTVVALIVGVLLGLGITMAAVGLLPFAFGGTLYCTVNTDGAVTTCANGSGQQLRVPHHIVIRNA